MVGSEHRHAGRRGRNAKSVPSRAPERDRGKRSAVGETTDRDQSSDTVPLEVQQKCLDIFKDSFNPGPDDATVLQQVKGHLFDRNFAAAFGEKDHLRIYASRWSPSRALGYLQVFAALHEHLVSSRSGASGDRHWRFAVLGGGAGAELIAVAGWMKQMLDDFKGTADQTELRIVDIADWANVLNELQTRVSTAPQLSKYASQARRDANHALLDPHNLQISFQRLDILSMDVDALSHLTDGVQLVTFMFTLNELYSASVPQTQRLLQRLMRCMSPGAMLLVVDSPGSYSTVSISGAEKRYPMLWLLDYTLLGSANGSGESGDASWQKIVSHESKWFRLPPGLDYPIELENMRYQIHLFKKMQIGKSERQSAHDGARDVEERG